jgi:hypothetical protein
MKKIEYLHLITDKVYSHFVEYLPGSEEYKEFQASKYPETLGFTYERDYPKTNEQEPETV